MDREQIIAALRSGNLELQALALEEARGLIENLIGESLCAFLNSNARALFAEQLLGLGPVLIPRLERLLTESSDRDARNHAAALLVQLGSKAGVPQLLSLLNSDSGLAPLAASSLAKASIREATPFIEAALERWDCRADPYSAASLVDALKKLGGISDSLRESLRKRWPVNLANGLESLLAS